ncbi:phosphorylated adapter RNA export protein [Ambystoma mexicanum]|uniref:phosphorylated adapter RNA export protein n=1 Tax=Ambystoma mexicanum TaxID=8296 RepID=UPI0037E90BF9
MADVEDGELSDSDTDMKVVAPSTLLPGYPPEQTSYVNSTAPRVQGITATLPSITSYRTTKGAVSSDDSASDSDDDRSLWKRPKHVTLPLKPEPLPFVLSHPRPAAPTLKKVNNIWGSVLQDQSQDAVATELGILGMDGQLDMSRQSEAYNYILAKKLMEQVSKQGGEEMADLDKELDEYMNEKKKPSPKEEKSHAHLKRRRPVKERLGERMGMNMKGRCEITEEDSDEKVADEIAYRLCEPKKDLISRVVQTIGKKKAIEILMETGEVEENGGLFIMNGSRRRTPGGVYLNLLKSTPSITGEQIKAIFHVEVQKECETKKAAKKRRRYIYGVKIKQKIKSLNLQEHDDASRETFASDTNEALASLDDSHDAHVEMKGDPEDAIEIDHTEDLETF